MITLEEAEAEHNAELAREEGGSDVVSDLGDSSKPTWLQRDPDRRLGKLRFSTKIIAQLPSFRLAREVLSFKDTSYFSRLFSSRKLNRVAVDYDEDEEEEDDEEEWDDEEDRSEETGESDDSQGDGARPRRRRRAAGHGEEDDDVHVVEPLPPMPKLGKPVNMDLLLNRSATAIKSMDLLMSMVQTEVQEAISVAKHIPVHNDFDRAAVTSEISESIAKVRTFKGIQDRLNDHVISAQKVLNFRRSALVMMNANYQQRLVREPEPIYVNEARTILKHKD
eukprot:gene6434-7096_t